MNIDFVLDENNIKLRLQKDFVDELNEIGNDNIANSNIEEFIKHCSLEYLEIVNKKSTKC